jgi:hypothetical protein
MPTTFGPPPGPCQGAYWGDFKAQLKQTKVTKATITFRAHIKSVSDPLPNNSYGFGDRNMVTFALVVESFRDLAGLGGGEYDLFALYHVFMMLAMPQKICKKKSKAASILFMLKT